MHNVKRGPVFILISKLVTCKMSYVIDSTVELRMIMVTVLFLPDIKLNVSDASASKIPFIFPTVLVSVVATDK